MRELILKNCNVILDSNMTGAQGFEDASSLLTAQGDIDGDGQDEIVVCSHSRMVAIMKGSQVFHVTNQGMSKSLCSVHILPVTGNLRSDIITMSLTGICTIYQFKGSLRCDDNRATSDALNSNKMSMKSLEIPTFESGGVNKNQNNLKNCVDLNVFLRQTIATRNATATQIFM